MSTGATEATARVEKDTREGRETVGGRVDDSVLLGSEESRAGAHVLLWKAKSSTTDKKQFNSLSSPICYHLWNILYSMQEESLMLNPAVDEHFLTFLPQEKYDDLKWRWENLLFSIQLIH